MSRQKAPDRERWLSARVVSWLVSSLVMGLAPTGTAVAGETVVRKDQGQSPLRILEIKSNQDRNDEAEAESDEGFRFGSYGRVSVGSDLEGGTGRQVRLVAHPPRLLETSYSRQTAVNFVWNLIRS